MIEKHLIMATDRGVQYRVRPNPDADPEDNAGIVIEFRNHKGGEWLGYFFVAPESVEDLANALLDMRI